MFKTHSYYDLCVQEEAFKPEICRITIKTLYDYGYRTIAVNQYLDVQSIQHNKKKKKKGEPRETEDHTVPVPYNLEQIETVKKELGIDDLKAFNRLTIIFSSQDDLHVIRKSPLYKKYDIIAVQPESSPALTFCGSNMEADILTFNPENRPIKLIRKIYYLLIDKGYHFELLYSPAIQDSTKRKNLIQASHNYHSFGKSRNIIISSGATSSFFIRSPYDIINLGILFGLSEVQCKNSISNCTRNTVINSVSRTNGKSVMFVENERKQEKKKEKILIISDEDDDVEMEVDEPVLKKSKQ